MSTPGLSAVAGYVFRSLRDHPDLSLPEAIATGPAVDGRADVASVEQALTELEGKGLAERGPDRGWRLTEAALSR
ncbi:MAG: hypothetical protein QOH58_389 [Thermoleophilaceae bacterium]|jgi:hypothetical protein|nr:hypothetical protein [Thermoleophilaceae bacterium]